MLGSTAQDVVKFVLTWCCLYAMYVIVSLVKGLSFGGGKILDFFLVFFEFPFRSMASELISWPLTLNVGLYSAALIVMTKLFKKK
jgi:hypothetical protein